jgi:hypothetical protein
MPPYSPLDTFMLENGAPSSSSLEIDDFVTCAAGPLNTLPPSESFSRSVSFAVWEDIVEIAHRSELSEEDIGGSWISKQELSGIRKEVMAVISLLDCGIDLFEEDDLSDRGLAMYTQENSAKKNERMRSIHKAISDLQNEENEDDHTTHAEKIAECYQRLSLEAKTDAHEIALNDAKEALQR